MLMEILVGSLAVAVSAQEDTARAERHDRIEIPPIEVQVPELDIRVPPIHIDGHWIHVDGQDIEIPEFDFEMPELDFEMPEFDVRVPEIEVDVSGLAYHMPHLRIDVPMYGFDVGDWIDLYSKVPRDGDVWREGAQDTDTVFEVDPTGRLEVKNHAGSIVIDAWDRNQVRVRGRHSRRDVIGVQRSSGVVTIKSESRSWGPSSMVDYEITVPKSMGLRLSGPFSDMSVTGTENDVTMETVKGFITLRDVRGMISVRSVEGAVEIVRCVGRIEVSTVDEQIAISESEGQIFAETIDGDIFLDGIRSSDVEGRTVDGDVLYRGTINDDGRYRLTTHDGDVVIAIPPGANATVSVATFDGELESDFPIEITEVETRRRFSFTLGDGRARLELQSFDGDIRLERGR